MPGDRGVTGKAFAVAKRETASFFHSPVAWVTGTVFLLLDGYFFYTFVTYYHLLCLRTPESRRELGVLTLSEGVIRPLLENVSFIAILVIPLLTMGLFARERRDGLLEMNLSWPVRPWEIVAGKFAAALLFFTSLSVLALLEAVWLFRVADPDPGVFVSGFTGLFLVGSAFIAVGILLSSITANVIAAAVSTFCALLAAWSIGWTVTIVPVALSRAIEKISLLHRTHGFFGGVIDAGDIAFFLALTAAALTGAARFIASSGWRGKE